MPARSSYYVEVPPVGPVTELAAPRKVWALVRFTFAAGAPVHTTGRALAYTHRILKHPLDGSELETGEVKVELDDPPEGVPFLWLPMVDVSTHGPLDPAAAGFHP